MQAPTNFTANATWPRNGETVHHAHTAATPRTLPHSPHSGRQQPQVAGGEEVLRRSHTAPTQRVRAACPQHGRGGGVPAQLAFCTCVFLAQGIKPAQPALLP